MGPGEEMNVFRIGNSQGASGSKGGMGCIHILKGNLKFSVILCVQFSEISFCGRYPICSAIYDPIEGLTSLPQIVEG